MLMLVGLLEKIELSAEIQACLSVSAEELRKVLTEPDLASATHHDLESIMNAFLKALEGIKVTELPEELVPLRADVVDRIPITSGLWTSLTQ
tara:strand:- start:90 stop:365 length:276 start_codon:yes stop_codon:yes gene_type:complete